MLGIYRKLVIFYQVFNFQIELLYMGTRDYILAEIYVSQYSNTKSH